ncbi:hypothetical protein L249_6253 [Ophiocordyceps polyrhachis-furcata BCC 54312]|uniref:Uncharacterized protein n=1 Tax=Ophiocordyceps polyrhachis-furcata BCC 54312 TaxID=1330021 RepID=A0A367L106_9HYPO|nr:hypothetical protein L249_6253 [Ophiocordyceps polyrhachis-furcata BCC 54312]
MTCSRLDLIVSSSEALSRTSVSRGGRCSVDNEFEIEAKLKIKMSKMVAMDQEASTEKWLGKRRMEEKGEILYQRADWRPPSPPSPRASKPVEDEARKKERAVTEEVEEEEAKCCRRIDYEDEQPVQREEGGGRGSSDR